MDETLAVILAKSENQKAIKALTRFVIEHTKQAELNEAWIDEIWQYLASYSLKIIIPSKIQPIWSRIMIDPKKSNSLGRYFLAHYQHFLEQYPLEQGIKQYQTWLANIHI